MTINILKISNHSCFRQQIAGILGTKRSYLLLSQERVDERDPGGIGGGLIKGRKESVNVEGGSGVDMAISSHLNSVVSNVEDSVGAHLGIEGGVGNTKVTSIASKERVEVGLGLTVESSLREGRLILPHVVEEVEEVGGRDGRLANNGGSLCAFKKGFMVRNWAINVDGYE